MGSNTTKAGKTSCVCYHMYCTIIGLHCRVGKPRTPSNTSYSQYNILVPSLPSNLVYSSPENCVVSCLPPHTRATKSSLAQDPLFEVLAPALPQIYSKSASQSTTRHTHSVLPITTPLQLRTQSQVHLITSKMPGVTVRDVDVSAPPTAYRTCHT
jgi:hypothetical protein